ncbi:Vgb family protein [Treponema pedis]|uniref:Lipoprotein n=1 Tax=Treponema pedis TaxID=409322 RepID=A0A7S6WPP3_9SPIR|nr:hypothetical protein [Treponema pedis]QOW61038.1 hypothetical protein IFE08_01060 [Treponema pedis]
MNKIHMGVFLIGTAVLAHCNLFAKEHIEIKKIASSLSAPVGMAFDSKGYLYIANWSAGRIDRYRSGKIETVIKDIPSPSGLAIDTKDTLYIATYSGGVIYKVQNGKKSTFISGLSVVAGITFNDNGNLLVAERGKSRVLSVSPEGKISVLADKGLSTPVAVIQAGKDRYVINDITGTIYLYQAKNAELTVLSKTLNAPAAGLIPDPFQSDSVLTVDYGGKGLYRISLTDGKTDQLTDKPISPVGLIAAADSKELYIAAWGDNSLYKITFEGNSHDD